MEKKRLAVQFFGHLRTFQNTFESFFENVIEANSQNFEIDIFIHTWDEIEYSFENWHNCKTPQVLGKKLTSEDINFINEKYKPKKFKYTPQLIIDNDEEYTQFTNEKIKFSNIKNVYYSKFEVNNLRKEYEKENNLFYDYILYARGDILFEKKFDLNAVLKIYETELKGIESTENKLFFSGCHRDLEVKEEKLIASSDILYFANSEVINKIADIFLELEEDKKNYQLKNNFLSWEYYFLYKIKQKHITPIQIKYGMRDWKLLRFNDIFDESIKEKEKRKEKFLSLRIRKNYIRFIINKFFIKLDWGNTTNGKST